MSRLRSNLTGLRRRAELVVSCLDTELVSRRLLRIFATRVKDDRRWEDKHRARRDQRQWRLVVQATGRNGDNQCDAGPNAAMQQEEEVLDEVDTQPAKCVDELLDRVEVVGQNWQSCGATEGADEPHGQRPRRSTCALSLPNRHQFSRQPIDRLLIACTTRSFLFRGPVTVVSTQSVHHYSQFSVRLNFLCYKIQSRLFNWLCSRCVWCTRWVCYKRVKRDIYRHPITFTASIAT